MVGHNTTSELWDINYPNMRRFVDKIIPFINIQKGSVCLDMGEKNPKMEYIKSKLNIKVDQARDVDFNFASYGINHYDAVFALEVIEHLQNPLFFMNELKRCIIDNGKIYITIPNSPRMFWMDGHYFEITPKHFKKWILEPLGLEIVQQRKILFFRNHFGIRPLIRIIKGIQSLKQTIKLMFHYKFYFYEIKKADI